MRVRFGVPWCVLLAGCGCAGSVENPWLEPLKITVTSVHDGDTFTFEPPLDVGGMDYDDVRFACIDAPEVGDHPECYGDEAQVWLEDRILGKQVTLFFDEEPDLSYNRIVATVRHNLVNLNVALVKKGYARAYEDGYFDQHMCCDEVKEAMYDAQDAGRGAWGECEDEHWDEELD